MTQLAGFSLGSTVNYQDGFKQYWVYSSSYSQPYAADVYNIKGKMHKITNIIVLLVILVTS